MRLGDAYDNFHRAHDGDIIEDHGFGDDHDDHDDEKDDDHDHDIDHDDDNVKDEMIKIKTQAVESPDQTETVGDRREFYMEVTALTILYST